MNILGITIDERLSVSRHVSNILSSCPSEYVMLSYVKMVICKVPLTELYANIKEGVSEGVCNVNRDSGESKNTRGNSIIEVKVKDEVDLRLATRDLITLVGSWKSW